MAANGCVHIVDSGVADVVGIVVVGDGGGGAGSNMATMIFTKYR